MKLDWAHCALWLGTLCAMIGYAVRHDWVRCAPWLGTLCAMIGYAVSHESVWQQGKPPWLFSQSSFEVSGRNITQCPCGCARIRTESRRNTNETVYCFSSLLGITDVDSSTVVRNNSKSKLFYFVTTNIPRLTHILNIAPPLFLVFKSCFCFLLHVVLYLYFVSDCTGGGCFR